MRCGCHSISYKKFINLMTKSLVQDMVTLLNMFPYKNWISNDLIPAAIILGSPNPYYNKLRIAFGDYAQVHIGTTNNTKQITVVEITLRSENKQGGYYFMSVYTGRQLHAYVWTELPINEQVIHRVYNLATKGKQPEIIWGYTIFKWRPVIPIMYKDNNEHILVR